MQAEELQGEPRGGLGGLQEEQRQPVGDPLKLLIKRIRERARASFYRRAEGCSAPAPRRLADRGCDCECRGTNLVTFTVALGTRAGQVKVHVEGVSPHLTDDGMAQTCVDMRVAASHGPREQSGGGRAGERVLPGDWGTVTPASKPRIWSRCLSSRGWPIAS